MRIEDIAECVIFNEAGVLISWNHALTQMDESLWAQTEREMKHRSALCGGDRRNLPTYTDFWTTYCAAHRKKHGKEFPPNTRGYYPKDD